MTAPFPGMNPYLENPALWPEVHAWLIVQLARSLNAVIKPKYRAAVEQRVYNDSLLVGIPDVSVFQNQPGEPRASTMTRTVSQPLKVTIPMSEEVKESYLEIRLVSTGQVVTVVEILSPKNKRPGEGQDQYTAKRRRVFESRSHLVEIDLLRTGTPPLVSGGIPSDYRILVSRADHRPEAELYSFNLRDTIPIFDVPLQAEDSEPRVNLQTLLQQIYEDAALDLVIDYSQPPVPPVSDNDLQWIQTLCHC